MKPVTQHVLDLRRRKALGLRQCYKCKQEKPIAEFKKDRQHSTGYAYICSVCFAQCVKGYIRKPSAIAARSRAWVRGAGKYSKAKVYAKRRGLSWDITREDYERLMSLPCAYCDGPLPEAGIGLDRIDNAIGYELVNVVQCCTVCNRAKSDFFTYSEMIRTIGPAIKYIRKCRADKM